MKLIPEGRRGKILLSACIVLVISLAAALTLGVLLAGGCDGGKNGGDSDADADADGKTSADSTVFQESDAGNAADTDTDAGGDPWKACREQGLSVSELFAYTGPNPDCGFEQGNDIAAVTVENISGKYLLCAEITVASDDGAEYSFTVQALEDGGRVTAFDTLNRTVKNEVCAADSECSTEFANSPDTYAGRLQAQVISGEVTLTNISEDTFEFVFVDCRCTVSGESFGGKVFECPFSQVTPGATQSKACSEILFGVPEAVRIRTE